MHLDRVGAIAAVLGVAASAGAQQGTTSPVPSAHQVDVNRLPINVDRIQRELRQTSSTIEQRDGLNLRYQVDVFGRAPAIKLFTAEDNLRNGPVPYGGPTHREMIEHVTPQEYRAPVMDFNALFKWLADKAK